jgi:hypothetical protein
LLSDFVKFVRKLARMIDTELIPKRDRGFEYTLGIRRSHPMQASKAAQATLVPQKRSQSIDTTCSSSVAGIRQHLSSLHGLPRTADCET